MTERVYYAIGDVHGEARRLEALHATILLEAASSTLPTVIVHLGDLIDRGARSRDAVAAVLALHTAPPEGVTVVSLRGNHEQMLLDAYDDRDPRTLDHWLSNGGDSAVASYEATNGIHDDWRTAIDAEHIAFMRAMPTLAYDEGRRIAFVHGGIDPAQFPNCPDNVRLWTRSARFFNAETWPDRPELEDLLVVHGHTPTRTLTPDAGPRRINIDTGAVFGGPLTAVALAPGRPPRFLTA